MLLLLTTSSLSVAPPTVSVRALHRAPASSVASYIALPPRTVEVRAIVSWPPDSVLQGWLLEASVRSETAGSDGEWFDWEPAATLSADETSHILSIEAGLAYRFRLAGLSDAEGQLPFSAPTAAISALGDPLLIDESTSAANARSRTLSLMNAQLQPPPSPPPPPPPPPAFEEVMPWDSPRPATHTPAPAPALADNLRSDVWTGSEQPLLSTVPTTAELALLHAQSSLLAAVRDGGRRVRIDLLPPGLNRAIEGSHPLCEPLLGYSAIALAEALKGLRVTCIFASTGTAAAASRAYERFSGRLATCAVGGFSRAVTKDALSDEIDFTGGIVDPADASDVYLIVAPTNSRGDAVALAVQQAVDKVPGACWALLNPNLEDTILAYVFGIATSDAVRATVGDFDTAYYYRGVFQVQRPSNRPLERGCLLRHYRGPWVAYGLCAEAAGGGFDELARWEEQPRREELAALAW